MKPNEFFAICSEFMIAACMAGLVAHNVFVGIGVAATGIALVMIVDQVCSALRVK